MTGAIVVGLAAAAVGLVLGVVLLRRAAAIRAEGLYRSWRAEEARSIGAGAAAASRLEVKSRIGGQAGLSALAADGRWLGDPAHLVVFDGDSEVKAGTEDELRAITFVVPDGPAREGADAILECVAAGRVRWETLRYP